MADIVNAVILKEGKLLTVRRGRDPFFGMYGFPGGHVEKGETRREALTRELLEEAKSVVKIGERIATIGDSGNQISLFFVEILSSKEFSPNNEISELKWMTVGEFISNLKDYGVECWAEVERVLTK